LNVEDDTKSRKHWKEIQNIGILITSPIDDTGISDVRWLLNQAVTSLPKIFIGSIILLRLSEIFPVIILL